MKKILAYALPLLLLAACVNDDQYTWDDNFEDRTATDTIRVGIAYNGTRVVVTGDDYGLVTANGADVVVNSATNKFLQLILSGSTADGSLIIYSWKKLGVVLAGVSITNPNGPAINNQCGKAFYVTTASGTVNTLTDGTSYDVVVNAKGDTIDQKGTLFSEGQIHFQGAGALTVNGHAKNGIASDDYIVVKSGTLDVNVSPTGTNGIKVNDGFTILGGTLGISVAADGARGIKNDARTSIAGGVTTISTTGNCLIETVEDIADTTTCAGIKSDSLFTMTAGTLHITSTGDGGKGINCSENVEFSGGQLVVQTTGTNNLGKPKAIKSDTGIIVSGGSFRATCLKSWALDNGIDSEEPSDRVTVKGNPSTMVIQKRNVFIQYD